MGHNKSFNVKERKLLFGPPSGNQFQDSRGLGRIIYEKLLDHGNNVMQIDGITEEEDTFSHFLQRCIRTALHMRKIDFKPQDKITICTFNTLNSAVPLVASFFIGVIPSTVDPTLSLEDFKYFLQMLKPKAIFVGPESVDQVTSSLKAINLDSKIIVFGPSNNYESFDSYLAPIDGEESFQPRDATNWKDTAIILFSSGSTGKPKGICLNHSYFANFAQTPFYKKDDRILFYSSLYWVTQVSMTIANISLGFIKVVYPKYDGPANFCKVEQNCKLQTAFLPAPYLIDVIEYCRNQNITLKHLKDIILAGTPVTEKHLRLATETFPDTRILNCYGQTETGLISAYTRHENYVKSMEEKLFKVSCGKPVEGIIIKIADLTTGEPLGPYQEGEICVGGAYRMNGYYNVVSPDTYDSEGFTRSGDIGFYDEDEYIYIIDRCKEMLKYKSFPVSPSFIEDVLSRHPAIKQSVVVGVPHEVDGDHPIALVVPKEGVKIDPVEIQKFVDDKVDDRKRLRGGVKIIKEMPLGPAGKPDRRLLKSMVVTGGL